jgi:hypothetical protein
MTYIGDANDRATVLADADVFFLSSGYFAATDADEAAEITAGFDGINGPGFWGIGQSTAALIQVHDLVAPLDPVKAATYLSRLGAIAGALLANRDDKRGFREDPFRGRVMPAWGESRMTAWLVEGEVIFGNSAPWPPPPPRSRQRRFPTSRRSRACDSPRAPPVSVTRIAPT